MAVFTVIKKVGPGVITAIPQRIATLSNIIENFIIDIPCQHLRGRVWSMKCSVSPVNKLNRLPRPTAASGYLFEVRAYRSRANSIASRTCFSFSGESVVLSEPIFPFNTV